MAGPRLVRFQMLQTRLAAHASRQARDFHFSAEVGHALPRCGVSLKFKVEQCHRDAYRGVFLPENIQWHVVHRPQPSERMLEMSIDRLQINLVGESRRQYRHHPLRRVQRLVKRIFVAPRARAGTKGPVRCARVGRQERALQVDGEGGLIKQKSKSFGRIDSIPVWMNSYVNPALLAASPSAAMHPSSTSTPYSE